MSMSANEQAADAGRSSAGRDIPAFPWCACVFAVALVARLVYIWQASRGPTFSLPIVDAMEYDAMARAAAAGKGISLGFFWQPFFYPAFLSGIYAFSGSSALAAKIVQAAIGSLTCSLTCVLGGQVFGRRAGLLAGLMAAVYGPLIFFDCELLGTGLESFWAIVLLILLMRKAAEQGWRSWMVLGVCGAMSVLTRPTFLPFFAASCLWLAAAQRRAGVSARRLVLHGVALVSAFLLLTVPVARLNSRLSGHFGILPYSGGINLYVGNNDNTAATITARPGWAWDDLTLLPKKYGVKPGYDTSTFFARKVLEYARSHPGGYLRGLALKAAQFFSARELPRNDDVYVIAKWSGFLRAMVWKAGRFGFPFGIVFPLALAGLVLGWRKVPWPVWLFIVLYPAAVVLVFVTARYRMPVIPAVLVLASGGIVGAVEIARQKKRLGLAALAAGAAAVAVACSLPGPFPQELTNYEAEMYYCLARIWSGRGQLDNAEALLARAIELEPGYGDACNSMGVIKEQRGNLPEAARFYAMAAGADSRHVTARVNLAEVQYKLGRMDECAENCRKVLALDPARADMHLRLGLVLAGQRNLDEAIVHFGDSVSLLPGDVVARTNLGLALAEKGNRTAAIEHYRMAVGINPAFQPALDALVAALCAENRLEDARNACRAALARVQAAGNKEAAVRTAKKLESLGAPR